MNIREIRAVGLRGATPEGGWSNEIQPDDCVHTLIAVLTDAGVTGFPGEVNSSLWEASCLSTPIRLSSSCSSHPGNAPKPWAALSHSSENSSGKTS